MLEISGIKSRSRAPPATLAAEPSSSLPGAFDQGLERRRIGGAPKDILTDHEAGRARNPTPPDHQRISLSFHTAWLLPLESSSDGCRTTARLRSEEQTSELQSLMRITYAGFFLQKHKHTINSQIAIKFQL